MQIIKTKDSPVIDMVPSGPRADRRRKWYEVVQDFIRSEQSQKRYCERHQINTKTLQYWISKFSVPRSGRFIPAQTDQDKPRKQEADIEVKRLCSLELGGDKRLVIESAEALRELGNILRAIQ